MSSEAIDYVKKPVVEFIKDSWRLVKRCTKPDRHGALGKKGLVAAAARPQTCLAPDEITIRNVWALFTRAHDPCAPCR